ncbi:unnamed protein product [Rotaria sordida]|uniref:Protein kinase domain-containing protein n=1 Tax=Rotaria sordida TaxID=392033 RepID=A0A814D097_9BILA|nr:unnamed protein product [Rotaria sordida]CAF0947480.1 unnamed protein product [Rotaria sordida]CAF3859577.1 unnamed protein product [Rotaria sordida]CAF3904110.1 unnamed protein product [Rotaria sordida]
MEKNFSIKTHSFIDAQRQNRRRRYSISSPNLFESRAGAIVRQYDNIINRLSRTNFSKTYSISSNSNLIFSSTNYNLEKYDILSKLNIGFFGSTYLIRDSNDGQMYILKRIDYYLPDIFRKRLFQERYLLNFLKSNYILSLISSYIDIEHKCFSMKFEYISGITLLHLLRQVRWFEESAVAFYSAQIVLAFEYLHELNIIYRNLKLETILLTDNGYIKLCDFAFAKLLSSHSSYTYSIVGVPDIMPPEILLGRPYSYSVDWWQLGIAMFEMLTSCTPFFSSSMFQTHKNVLNNYRYKFPSHISSLARCTCMMLLQPNIKKRLGCSLIGMDAKEVKQNIWFKNHVDWTAIIERSHPAPYRIKNLEINSNKTISMLNTIESKWLDEYDQAVRFLMNVNFPDENDSIN